MNTIHKTNEQILKDFMIEFFDYEGLKKIGVYGKDISKNDYQKQADRICQFFGFKTVFEYVATELRAHISYVKGKEPKKHKTTESEYNGFITEFKNIYN